MNLARLTSRMRAWLLTSATFLAATSIASAQQITTIAGGLVGDGPTPSAAALATPGQLAMDASGNLYVADSAAHRVRKITPAGVVSTYAGNGLTGFAGDNGQATQARLFAPGGLAFDSAGNLYVSDRGNNRVRKITPAGVISTVAGDGSPAVLDRPGFLAVGTNGTIYVVETKRNRVRKIVGGVVSAFAGTGGAGYAGDNGLATSAALHSPTGIEVDASGNVFIADTVNNVIRRVDTYGVITTWAAVNSPEDVAFDAGGNLFALSDFGVMKVAGNVQVVGGSLGAYGFAGDGGNASNAVFNLALSLLIGGDGRMYISDYYNQRIRVVSSGSIDTWVGPGATGDGGQALAARVSNPGGVAYDAAGNLYVSETYQNRIRKITPAGVISTYAGTGQTGFSGDGGQATSATFNQPQGLAVMADGSLLVADYNNHRVRKIATDGVISTFAGNGTYEWGFDGDGGPATSAMIAYPRYVAVNADGDVFISHNDRVRKVHAGFITTFAGGMGDWGEGVPANETMETGPGQVGFDAFGNTYFADTWSNTVRKVTPGGLVYTVAGQYMTPGSDIYGGSATVPCLNAPFALAVDPNGDFWVSDTSGWLSKVSGGTIQPVAGTGRGGFNGDGSALSTMLTLPMALVRNGSYLVIADSNNSRVRRMDTGGSPGAPRLTIVNGTVTEGNSGTKNLTFTAQLSAASASAVTFDVSTLDGTATAGSDYVATTLTGLSIAAGQTGTTFNVPIVGDSVVEPNENFTVTMANVTGAQAVGYATGTISNDDTASGPQLSIGNVTVSEGDSGTKLATFTISLSASQPGPVSVDVATADVSAAAGSDYVGKSQLGLSIAAGTTSQSFAVTINGDTASEADELFTVNLSNAVGATINHGQAVGTITNDDSVPVLSINDVSVAEGNSGTTPMTFRVSLSAPSAYPVTFHADPFDGTAGYGSDYFDPSDYVGVISPGNTYADFVIGVVGDVYAEQNEDLFVSLTSPHGAVIGDGDGRGVILNDDGPTLSINDVSISEGDSSTKNLVFTVTLSAPQPGPVTFDLATADYSAAAGSDYVARSLVGASIAAGQTSRTFAVAINGDTTSESNESFMVNLSNASGATIIDDQGVGTIKDDDSTAILSIDDVSISEGNSGTRSLVFTVSLSAPLTAPVTFNLATANGSATAGSDYVARSLVGASIAAGQTTRTFAVSINGDTTVEPNETFVVNLSNASGAAIADSQGVGTIKNDDVAVLPTLSINDLSVSEGDASTKLLVFTITLSAPQSGPVSFDVATADGSATGGTDYVVKSVTGSTIAAGATTKTFGVTIKGDTTVEPNETFKVNLSNALGATIADGQGVGTITNDDVAPAATLSINDVSISEGNASTRSLVFTVTLSAPQPGAVTFNLATANGTAIAGSDYVARTLTGASIGAGQTTRTFAVTINGDTTVEPNETLKVNLSNASGASIADSQGVGTILNDDAAALTVARFDARGLVDDVDDGNRQPQIAPSEYAALLADTANSLCRRAPNATVIAVEGVEHKQVLSDLADAASTLCPGKPQYTAVMADKDSRGFLIATPAKDEVGTTVLSAPEPNLAAKSTTLSVLGAGHATPVTIVLANGASKALFDQLRLRAKANPDEAIVLLGAKQATDLVDLSARELGAKRQRSATRVQLPAERVLVNGALLRLYRTPAIELAPLPVNEAPSQVLRLQ